MPLFKIDIFKPIFNLSTILGFIIFFGSIFGHSEVLAAFQQKKLSWIAVLCFLSLFLMSQILSFLLIIYGAQVDRFARKYNLAESYVDSLPSEKSSNLFKDSFMMIVYLIVGIIPGLVGAWFVYYTKNIGIWPLLMLCVFYTIYVFRGKKGIIIFHLIYLPVVFLGISAGEHEIVGFFLLFLMFLLMFERNMSLFRSRKGGISCPDRKASIRNFIILIQRLSADAHQKIYSKGAVTHWQALVIVMIFFAYAILPNILPFIPPSYYQEFYQYSLKINNAKDYIPYIAFFFYSALSILPFFQFIVGLLSFRQDDNLAWKRGVNVVIIFAIGILLLPMFITLSMVFSLLIIALMNSMFGFYFALLLGFFVFPVWVTRIYSYIPALMLLVTPNYILTAWLDGSDMWTFKRSLSEFKSN